MFCRALTGMGLLLSVNLWFISLSLSRSHNKSLMEVLEKNSAVIIIIIAEVFWECVWAPHSYLVSWPDPLSHPERMFQWCDQKPRWLSRCPLPPPTAASPRVGACLVLFFLLQSEGWWWMPYADLRCTSLPRCATYDPTRQCPLSPGKLSTSSKAWDCVQCVVSQNQSAYMLSACNVSVSAWMNMQDPVLHSFQWLLVFPCGFGLTSSHSGQVCW